MFLVVKKTVPVGDVFWFWSGTSYAICQLVPDQNQNTSPTGTVFFTTRNISTWLVL